MTRRALAVLMISLGLGGCLADARIARLKVELADDVRHGRQHDATVNETRILKLADEAFGAVSPEAVRVRTDLAESWAQWKRPDQALALANATLDAVEQRYGPGDERTTLALMSLARIHYVNQRWSDAESVLDRTSQICRRVLSRGTSPAGPPGDCVVQVRSDIPRYSLAIGAHRKWLDDYLFFDSHESEDAFRNDRNGGISMLTALGRGHAENGAYPEASWYFQRCVDELRPRYQGPVPAERTVWADARGDVEVVVVDAAHSFHSQSPRCLEDLIAIRRKLGEDEEAAPLSTWQRELWARGPDLEKPLTEQVRFADHAWHDDFLTSSRANDLAFYYAGKGRYGDARRSYAQAVGLIDRALARDGVFAGNFPTYLLIDELLGLGQACEQLGDFAQAQAAYQRATAIAERELHPRHAWRLEGRAGAARAADEAGNHRKAIDEWDLYLKVAEKIRGRGHADYALGLAGLAAALEASGSHAEAIRTRERAESTWNDYRRRVQSTRDLPLPVSLRSPASTAN